MLSHISLKYTSESLALPSLRYLSLLGVNNIKHRMNVLALTKFHELDGSEKESFPVSLPSLIEYGIYRIGDNTPLDVTKLHQCYPNISRLSVRAPPSAVKLFLHSLSDQPTALPMLRTLAVGIISDPMEYSVGDKDSMRNDVFTRNMASSVKMELYFDGMARVPLYFSSVRVTLTEVEVN